MFGPCRFNKYLVFASIALAISLTATMRYRLPRAELQMLGSRRERKICVRTRHLFLPSAFPANQ